MLDGVKEEKLKDMVATPIAYNKNRANEVYENAFLRGFEYILGTGGMAEGDILEFGTFTGFSAHVIAKLMKWCRYSGHLWLYDSFEGLPNSDAFCDKNCYLNANLGKWREGSMKLPMGFENYIADSLEEIIPRESFTIVKGFFDRIEDSQLTKNKVSLVHLDCDLYSSTKCVLEKLISKDLLQDGTVLYCDDYNTNRSNPLMGQRRALKEIFNERDRFYCSEFFSYGWHAKAFFIHDREAAV